MGMVKSGYQRSGVKMSKKRKKAKINRKWRKSIEISIMSHRVDQQHNR